MALPTGTIDMSQVNVELGKSSTATISLNDADVRALAEVASGTISMDNLRGKSNLFKFNITSNQTNANLRTLAVNAGWNGTSKVEATINSSVTISGSTAGNSTAALTINGSFPNGVELINNGVIVGRGGNGGMGQSARSVNFGGVNADFEVYGGTNATAGGRALLTQVAVAIRNNGAIRGGGGGGAGGAGRVFRINFASGGAGPSRCGSGGGGGRSSLSGSSGGARADAFVDTSNFANRALAGTDGSLNGAGSAGDAGTAPPATFNMASSTRWTQGAWGCSGGTGRRWIRGGFGGNGGEWGASGQAGTASLLSGMFTCQLSAGNQVHIEGGPTSAGGAGQAVNGNSNITWLATGTRTGPIV